MLKIFLLSIIFFLISITPSFATTVQLLPNSTNIGMYHSAAQTSVTPSTVDTAFSDTNYNKTNVSDNNPYGITTLGVTTAGTRYKDTRFSFNLTPYGASNINWMKYCMEGYYIESRIDRGAATIYYYNVSSSTWTDSGNYFPMTTDATFCQNFTTNSIASQLIDTNGYFNLSLDCIAYSNNPAESTLCRIDFVNLTVSYTANNPPTLSYAWENPTDPATYVYGATYTFNVTVCDAQLVADISKVLFEWAGGANVSVTTYVAWNTTCRNYTTTKTDLAAQTATGYKWYANDSANAWATALSDTYTVSKGTLAGTISSPDVTYPTSISATGSESNAGDTDVNYQTCCGSTCTAGKGPNTYAFGAGAYSCVFNTTAGTYSNWTQSSNLQTDSVTVNKGSTTATLYLNGSTSSQTSVYSNSTVNATATSSISGLYVRIWRNGTLIANTTNTATNITQWGAWSNNFTAKVLGNVNYSDSASVMLWWNVSKGGTNTSLYLNGTEGNKSYNISDTANFTVSLNVSGKTVKLASDYAGWALQSSTTPLMNYTTLNSVGDWWNLTGYFEGDENYSTSSRTYFFNVTTGDTCTYLGSGDWNIDINDNCTLSSSNTVSGNINIYGSNGFLNFQANQLAHAYYYNVTSLGTWYYNNYRWLY